jgi:putative spermidine/putrescine transport system permease protein
MRETRGVRVGLRLATAGVLAFIYLPIVVLAIYAFNPSRLQAWPPLRRTRPG